MCKKGQSAKKPTTWEVAPAPPSQFSSNMASATPSSASTAAAATAAADPATRKEDAAEVLNMVLGAEVVAALHEGFAKGGDFTGVVPLLVAPGARPYLAAAARGALATACDAGKAGVAALLLEADGVRAEDADAESTSGGFDDGYTLLAAAVARGYAAVVRALVSSGKADVNAVGDTGDSALALAACQEDKACFRALLAADGIQINHADPDGHTALMHVADRGHTGGTLALLAVAGVDVNRTNTDGETALTLAALNDHAACMCALLAADGIDAGHANNEGTTALDCATVNNSTVGVRALVGVNGSDIGLGHRDPWDGKTALHYACENNNAEMASLLLVAGGCRFALEAAPAETRRTPLDLVGVETGDTKEARAVRAVFLSGVDYWQRRRHGGHSRAMRQTVLALMLVRQRLDARPPPTPTAWVAVRTPRRRRTSAATDTAPRVRALVHLPEEIWLLMCGFLRSADFPPC